MAKKLTDRINRWRHRRGYGVHSPAAFMLVKEVVCPQTGYRYYGEDRLDVTGMSGRDRLLCRLSLRLIGRLGARHIRLYAPGPLARLLKSEKIRFNADRTRPADSPAPVPVVSFDFERSHIGKGEVKLYAGILREDLSAETAESLIIEGKEFVIVYKTPGLTPLHVTV